jgi:hypothetical protein
MQRADGLFVLIEIDVQPLGIGYRSIKKDLMQTINLPDLVTQY